MTVALDILRGLIGYVLVLPLCGLLLWLILPPLDDFWRTLTALGGGGAVIAILAALLARAWFAA